MAVSGALNCCLFGWFNYSKSAAIAALSVGFTLGFKVDTGMAWNLLKADYQNLQRGAALSGACQRSGSISFQAISQRLLLRWEWHWQAGLDCFQIKNNGRSCRTYSLHATNQHLHDQWRSGSGWLVVNTWSSCSSVWGDPGRIDIFCWILTGCVRLKAVSCQNSIYMASCYMRLSLRK